MGEHIEAREIQIATIEQVKGSWFGKKFVQEIDIVDLASGHINTGRDAASQVQERVNFHGTFAPPELCPREEREAQIDGGGIEGVNRLLQFHAEGFVLIKLAGGSNQALSKIGIDAPVAVLVGISEGGARNRAAKAHMIEFGLLSSQTRFDVAQAFSISELSEGEAEKLIPTGKVFDVAMALVLLQTGLKLVMGMKSMSCEKITCP